MTTDKTLADVQPGGRVRLGGQAERARWRSMDTCPRDGTVVRLRWGEDHVSPGWWSAPVSPVQNDDGTWPSDTGGFPWAFIDFNNGSAFVNHAVDTEYGPTHWAPYAALSAQPSPGETVPPEMRLGSPDYLDYLDTEPSTGGQGEALAIEMACSEMHAVVQRAGGYRNGLLTEMLEKGMAALAARQPVGEPVLYIRPGLLDACRIIDPAVPYHRVTVALTERDGHTVPLYAAPPAQAVDLGQFRPAVCAMGLYAEEPKDVDEAKRLLALIDSMAVGK